MLKSKEMYIEWEQRRQEREDRETQCPLSKKRVGGGAEAGEECVTRSESNAERSNPEDIHPALNGRLYLQLIFSCYKMESSQKWGMKELPESYRRFSVYFERNVLQKITVWILILTNWILKGWFVLKLKVKSGMWKMKWFSEFL